MTTQTKHPIAPEPIEGAAHRPHRTRTYEHRRRAVEVPLACWPVAQVSTQYQRAGRYDPASAAHPGKMIPALAERIVAEFSAPGDTVFDPMAGIGTTLVEAAKAGRRGVGIELEERWAKVAESNCDRLLTPERRDFAKVIVGDARHLDRLLGDACGSVDLICTSPPYACEVGGVVVSLDDTGKRMLGAASERNYSTDKANLGYARGSAYEDAMGVVYAACFAALRPGGLLVTVTKNTRRQGRVLDLAAATVAICERVGFTYVGHVVALHAAVRDSALASRPSIWQTLQLKKLLAQGEPVHLVSHEDVCVLRRDGTRFASEGEVRDGE